MTKKGQRKKRRENESKKRQVHELLYTEIYCKSLGLLDSPLVNKFALLYLKLEWVIVRGGHDYSESSHQ